jgi:hypothetical protein
MSYVVMLAEKDEDKYIRHPPFTLPIFPPLFNCYALPLGPRSLRQYLCLSCFCFCFVFCLTVSAFVCIYVPWYVSIPIPGSGAVMCGSMDRFEVN